MGSPLVRAARIITPYGAAAGIAGLNPDGNELWRLQGSFNLAHAAHTLVGNRDFKDELTFCFIDPESGRITHSEPTQFGLIAVVPEQNRFIANRIVQEKHGEAYYLALMGLDRGLPASWEVALGDEGAREAEYQSSALGLDAGYNDGRIIIAHRSSLLAFALDTGRQLWRVSLAAVGGSPSGWSWYLVVDRGRVVINTGRGTAAFDATSGTPVWFFEKRGVRSIYGDIVYQYGFGPGNQRSQFHALNLHDGRVVWSRDLLRTIDPREEGNSFGSPLAVTETNIFVGDARGLWALDRKNGRPVWYHDPKGPYGFGIGNAPVIAGNRLYISGFGGPLYCYEQQPAAEGSSKSKPQRKVTFPEDEETPDWTVAFEIEEVFGKQEVTRRAPYFEKGGKWTVLKCRLLGKHNGTFLLAERAGKSMLSSGEGAIWVPSPKDGDALAKAFRRTFPPEGKLPKLRPATRVKPPLKFDLSVLGRAVAKPRSRSRAKTGSWTATKWTDESGAVELYVNWSLEEKTGFFDEKDDLYREDLCLAIASLVVRKGAHG